MSQSIHPQNNAKPLEAVLFDLDGVFTDTAVAHMAAWKKVFDGDLQERDPDADLFTQADRRTAACFAPAGIDDVERFPCRPADEISGEGNG